ncbi:hypothetical protein [Arhodomonas sp. AD133]|uniref:hypothetical protein n=1 Tax=Arhodomonas sp. AD133 TaxID=3415009 RepID=UPI003EC14320
MDVVGIYVGLAVAAVAQIFFWWRHREEGVVRNILIMLGARKPARQTLGENIARFAVFVFALFVMLLFQPEFWSWF